MNKKDKYNSRWWVLFPKIGSSFGDAIAEILNILVLVFIANVALLVVALIFNK